MEQRDFGEGLGVYCTKPTLKSSRWKNASNICLAKIAVLSASKSFARCGSVCAFRSCFEMFPIEECIVQKTVAKAGTLSLSLLIVIFWLLHDVQVFVCLPHCFILFLICHTCNSCHIYIHIYMVSTNLEQQIQSKWCLEKMSHHGPNAIPSTHVLTCQNLRGSFGYQHVQYTFWVNHGKLGFT